MSVRVLSVEMRVSRPAVRPIVRPVALPTVPRVVSFGSRTLVAFCSPIVLPIREIDLSSGKRRLGSDCFFVTDIDGSLLPMKLPMPRLRSVRSDDLLLLTLVRVEGLLELTAGCVAPDRIEELLSESLARVPIKLPIRERWLVVGSFLVLETDGVLLLLEPSMREALLERAAGCSAPLGTDGLVVLISLPIREVILGLILLLVLVVERFVITLLDLLKFKLLLLELLKFKLLLLELLTLDVPLLELSTGRLAMLLCRLFVLQEEFELLLDGVLVLIELTIREVMLGLILPFVLLWLLELGTDVRELIGLVEVFLLELGADIRELIDRVVI